MRRPLEKRKSYMLKRTTSSISLALTVAKLYGAALSERFGLNIANAGRPRRERGMRRKRRDLRPIRPLLVRSPVPSLPVITLIRHVVRAMLRNVYFRRDFGPTESAGSKPKPLLPRVKC